MCHVVGQAIDLADRQAQEQGLSRRSLLKRGAGAAGVAGLAGLGLPQLASANGGRRRRQEKRLTAEARRCRTRLVLLGTAGGPVWWPRSKRFGIASAVVVDGDVYMVDVGEGAFYQYRQAGLARSEEVDREMITSLRALFLTHMHADHTIEYDNLLRWAFANGGQIPTNPPVEVFGPGNRGELEPVSGPPPSSPLPVVNPENPTPGTVEMTDYLYKAFAADFNDHIRDSRVDVPWADFEVNDIEIPPGTVTDQNTEPSPPMDPFPVFEDEKVKVTATLVDHSPCWPAFAFRFDTDDGSITFSGDTGPNQNLIKMAKDTDLLVHEVIDKHWVEGLFVDPTTPEAQAIIKHLLGVHTLIEDVGAVAESAAAKSLVLTHLVPPHTPYSRWLEAGQGYSGRLIVGNDLMEVGVGSHDHHHGRHRRHRAAARS
jgi:ribonuclease BN (tRNA processing enzyme)